MELVRVPLVPRLPGTAERGKERISAKKEFYKLKEKTPRYVFLSYF
jgi:hypothetical protein